MTELKATVMVLGDDCPRCIGHRGSVESGESMAVRTNYRTYGILIQAGIRPELNDHGFTTWLISPGWVEPLLEIDGTGPGEDFLVAAIRACRLDTELRSMVQVTYRLGGVVAVTQLLKQRDL